MNSTPKNTDFRNSTPQKYSADPCPPTGQVHPLGQRQGLISTDNSSEVEEEKWKRCQT